MTSDDDLFGTRSTHNQLKKLSSRRSDREGIVAYVIFDAWFRLTLGTLFNLSGEIQLYGIRKLLDDLLDGCDEEILEGLLVTADHGYGKDR